MRKQDHHLIPFGWALGGTFALALALTGGGIWLGLTLVGFQHFQHEPSLSSSTFYNLLKLVFGIVAGIGGVIALVVSYRKQRIAESAEERDRTRVFNERFTTAAGQLGSEQAAVRLAGVYAMAGLADDWEDQRQTCIDVLCAYLRMPYVPEPSESEPAERAAWRGFREVRHTIIRVIATHLRSEARISWQGHNFDFTTAVFDGGDFSRVQFAGSGVSFDRATFTGDVSFFEAQFAGNGASFVETTFAGGDVSFYMAEFAGGRYDFTWYNSAKFTGGTVDFGKARFAGGLVMFHEAQFTGSGVSFTGARFSGGMVSFYKAQFADGDVSFSGAQFAGSLVSFDGAALAGGTVDFRTVDSWSVSPEFPWSAQDVPPPCVLMPPTYMTPAVD